MFQDSSGSHNHVSMPFSFGIYARLWEYRCRRQFDASAYSSSCALGKNVVRNDTKGKILTKLLYFFVTLKAEISIVKGLCNMIILYE